jgi:murein DD-endopeptidase MepM/ murein hydrolase activator NlpD
MVNGAQPPARRGRAIQIVGINAPGIAAPTAATPVTTPEIQDNTQQKYDQVFQDVQRVQEASAQVIDQSSKQKALELARRGHSVFGQELGGLAKAVTETIGFFQKQEQEKAAAKEKARIEQLQLATSVRLQDYTAQFLMRAAEEADKVSPDEAQQEADAILAQALQDGLPPDVAQTLRTRTFEEISNVRQRQATALLTTAERLRAQQVAQAENLLRVDMSPYFATLSQARTPAEAQQAATFILNALLDPNSGGTMSPLEKLQAVNPLITELATRLQGREDVFAGTVRTLSAVQELTQLYPQWMSELGGNEAAFQQRRAEWALQRGVDLGQISLFAPSPGEAAAQNLNLQQTQQSLLQIGQQQIISDLLNDPTSAAAIFASQVHNLINNPAEAQSFLALVETGGAAVTPEMRALAAQYRATKADVDAIQNRQVRLRELYTQIQRLGYQTVSDPEVRARAVTITNFAGEVQGLQAFQLPDGTYVQAPPRVSQAEFRSVQEQYILEYQQYQNAVAALQARGINPNNLGEVTPTLRSLQQRAQQLLEQRAQQAAEQAAQMRMATPNFNGEGDASGNVSFMPVAPVHRINDMVIPIRQQPDGGVVITSGYGDNRGTHIHNGIDLAFTGAAQNREMSIAALSPGRVISVAIGGVRGYGGRIQILTDDGHIEEYGHVWGANVQEGQRVVPGQQIATLPSSERWRNSPKPQGDVSRGSNPHLHFTVRREGARDFNGGNSIDPIAYLRARTQALSTYNFNDNRGVGAPPTQMRMGAQNPATTLIGGQALMPSMSTTQAILADLNRRLGFGSNQFVTPSQPMPQARASINRADYPPRNNPTHNYGYGVLRDNPRAARALAETADAINVPAQWLADIVQFESKWNPSARNNDSGAVGLIQFLPGTVELFRRSPGWNPAWTYERIQRMSIEEQLRGPVRAYLQDPPFQRRGFPTIEDLHAAIFLGYDGYRRNATDRARMGDGAITFMDYVRRLGEDVGRRYHTSYDHGHGATHTSFTAGCRICEQQRQQLRTIIPHNAP